MASLEMEYTARSSLQVPARALRSCAKKVAYWCFQEDQTMTSPCPLLQWWATTRAFFLCNQDQRSTSSLVLHSQQGSQQQCHFFLLDSCGWECHFSVVLLHSTCPRTSDQVLGSSTALAAFSDARASCCSGCRLSVSGFLTTNCCQPSSHQKWFRSHRCRSHKATVWLPTSSSHREVSTIGGTPFGPETLRLIQWPVTCLRRSTFHQMRRCCRGCRLCTR